MNDIDLIRKARARLDTDDGKCDQGLSVYMIRDMKITKDLELDDLAWSFEKSCGCWSEAVWLLDKVMEGMSSHGIEGG